MIVITEKMFVVVEGPNCDISAEINDSQTRFGTKGPFSGDRGKQKGSYINQWNHVELPVKHIRDQRF